MSPELSAVFIGSAIRFATPLLLGATGELVSQRAGVLNMSLEGMMLTGAIAGEVGSWATGNPLIGLALGILAVLPVAPSRSGVAKRIAEPMNTADNSQFICRLPSCRPTAPRRLRSG